ncbi:pyridine nucleotide-disulfide oxidoreductase-domain-containing protein [Leucosporidium creatinivorum]|uniref:Pyridine nucleotide-disulfide oxidoreductase-domain-containing protein n=1 Tax=Leucosporidium creatinivorum TaxID=106004 RepID=A0A1Y2F052_9BASI|nr:pyridine nucleotide-disulfide oxidoreductase-domain-containing protein [Leucosporidium creatinivorum]
MSSTFLSRTAGSALRPLHPTKRSTPLRAFSSTTHLDKQRLVILGSGWGGYELLRKVDKNAYDVVLVSPNTYFAFTPLLASTAVGTLEFRCALEPVRRYGDSVSSYQAWCDSIDLKRKRLECLPAVGSNVKAKLEKRVEEAAPNAISDMPGVSTPVSSFPGMKPFTVGYDKLVIAVGAYSQTFNTPGVKEYAHFLKDVKDARKIRSRILECFELASQPTLTDVERQNLLHFVIVGGGPTGVEFAAELNDLLASDMLRHYPALAPIARITIYDVAPKILGAFDEGLVKYAEKQFQRQGVAIKNNHHVTRVNEASIEIKEEGNVPFGMLVWSTGLAPNPLIDSITELEHDEKTHSLKVNGHFQPRYKDGNVCEDIYVIGDCAMLEEKLPATAQVANQEAKHLAKILNNHMRDRAPPGAFEFNNMGIMTYIGNWNALFDRSNASGGPKPKEAGRLAWLIWRSAYWSQALSLRNKASLAFYWFLNWIFGRSITRF